LILALADEPFIFDVQVVRDGNNYQARRVDVCQSDGKVVFVCTCSFKNPDPGFLDVQVRQNMERKYSTLMGGKSVAELPLKTDMVDLRAAYESGEPSLTNTFPGMLTSILPFEALHSEQKDIIHRRNVYIYTANENEQSPSQDPNLHAAAHMYHSDRESVWGILRQYELFDVMDAAASLSHTVIFHAGPEKLRFRDDNGNKRWFYLETGSKRLSEGRALHKGKIYDQDGNHVATTMQDGSLRLKFKSIQQKEERQEHLNAVGGEAKL
jgi:acyl-CoA thioesterase II